jgi:hypothetical protein
VCCERCHARAAPISLEARRWKPPKPPKEKPRKPRPYERLHTQVWKRLAREGEVFVMGAGRLAAYCPVCHEGTVSVWLIDTDPPRIRTEGCDAGCTPDLIADAIASAP